MANIALGKLPLESSWKRPELATDGVVSGYTENEGFAFTPFPENYTLEFDELVTISEIRVLICDNWAENEYSKTKRKYTFSLEYSIDGQIYYPLTKSPLPHGTGWFCFSFNPKIVAKNIRLIAYANSDNAEFHMVEFEVHDSPASPIEGPSYQSVLLNAQVNVASTIDIINEQISARSAQLKGIAEKVKTLDDGITKVSMLDKLSSFESAAQKSHDIGLTWIMGTTCLSIVLISFVVMFLYSSETTLELVREWNQDEKTASHTTYMLFSFYVGKAVLVSIISFLIGWTIKNYKAEKHNEKVNLHKAMALATILKILSTEEFNIKNRDKILEDALKEIFSHQASGYNTKTNENPSSLIQLVVSKAVD